MGPTGIGKTKFSLYLSNKLKINIISYDSQQFYKELNICTSKINTYFLKKKKHYFINIKSIYDFKKKYNIFLFKKQILYFLKIYFKKKNIIIMVRWVYVI
ncbi:MAG: isopentenyl transferase family protein [Candidatus Shikimatogenerans sp. Ttur]|uniref:Isopentenyl transferase family protein n=1 Tax=Candidatus Shikimatogenerans sp. Ttur TaxID=3158569 RepID=A0AAU7ZXJ7_9FLAO